MGNNGQRQQLLITWLGKYFWKPGDGMINSQATEFTERVKGDLSKYLERLTARAIVKINLRRGYKFVVPFG